jgi:hypothetical protein
MDRRVTITSFFLLIFLTATFMNAAGSLRTVPHFDLKMKVLSPETDNSALDNQTCENETESEQESEYSSETITILLPYYYEAPCVFSHHAPQRYLADQPNVTPKQPLQVVYQLFRI